MQEGKSNNYNELNYHSLFEQASDAIMVTDYEGNFTDVNSSLCKMFGYEKAELLQMNIEDLIEAEQLKADPIMFVLLAEGLHVFSNRNMLHKNGTIIEVEANVKKLDDNSVMAIARDVSELVKIKKQVVISEATFEGAFQYSAIGMAIVSITGEFIRVNKELCKITGYTEQEMVLLSFQQLTHKDDLDKDLNSLKLSLEGVINTFKMEKRYYHKNGSIIWIKLNVSLIRDSKQKPLYFISQIENISDRKKIEEELIEREKLLNIFIEHSPASIAMVDKDMNYLLTSKRWITDYNLGEQEVIGKSHYEVFPNLPQHWKEVHQRCMKGAIEQNEEDSFEREDGSTDWLQWEVRPWFKGSGEIGGIIMLTEVLTKRKKSEAELKKSKANLKTIFNTTDTAYLLIDTNLCIISYNNGAADFAARELSKEAKIGKHLSEYFLEDRSDRLTKVLNEVRQGKNISYETNFEQADGSQHWYFVQFFPISTPIEKDADGFMVSISNITERKKQENQINNQLGLLKEISFITSHELRHEYAKLYSMVDFLKDSEFINSQDKLMLSESLKTFDNLNATIYKINDKITFGQATKVNKYVSQEVVPEYVLLIDDDPTFNFINSRLLELEFAKDKILKVQCVDSAINLLKNDTKNDHYIIFLDLNMPNKNGWDFLEEYQLFEKKSPVIILTSSINPKDRERARKYDFVKKVISKPLNPELVKQITTLEIFK
ncbi:MAG: PAS domain S-box protein [Bacteroidota bacterium]|nr:PAS domain S-box protein [Bacteroidota bacterium]